MWAMNLGYLYTSFDGRINRKPYWLGSLLLMVPFIVIGVVAVFAVGTDPSSQIWANILISIIAAYPVTALMIKRLHDRNRPGIIAAVLWAPTVLMYLGQLTGLTGEISDVYGQAVFVPNMLGIIIYVLAFVVAIYWFIDLGCLRGTAGDNKYGPDPLDQSAS
jgi:uncharacterized membrane protein YhaH (DUF805 family)